MQIDNTFSYLQSNAPSTGAGSQGWSSFSDISNQISPALSCDDCDDSVNVSWRESEAEADLLTSQGNSETGCRVNVPLTSAPTATYQFDPNTTYVQQNVPTPCSEGICHFHYLYLIKILIRVCW